MKILHICLGNFYIDGYQYQENILPRIHKEDGHEVCILASTETYTDNLHLGYVEPGEYVTEFGVPIIRIPYVKMGTHLMTIKFRKYLHVYQTIAAFAPDVIFCHNATFWSVSEVVQYKKNHSDVKFYIDTHIANYNSGKNWLSLHFLHRLFYRQLVKKALPYLEKYFYIGEGERQFSIQNYGVPETLMEYYPLGGIVLPDVKYQEFRTKRRAELGLEEQELLLVHSGKLDAQKRTNALLQAFADAPKLKAKMAIIGSIPESQRALLTSLIKSDNRVIYLGWKSGTELQEYLCACDLYCQPGSVSATMQNAVCQNCPILAYPHEEYVKHLDYGNILWAKTEADMAAIFQKIAANPSILNSLQANSRHCAQKLLDYRKLAARVY